MRFRIDFKINIIVSKSRFSLSYCEMEKKQWSSARTRPFDSDFFFEKNMIHCLFFEVRCRAEEKPEIPFESIN